ncbi:hypothetical protein Taro_017482 [Colocasia esculenta]|uniref:histidine kinase n=1 Tax=Colocasia esculenta TaxID=4460 RepID=A0A843UNQ7_COLES|nr:hypothetical protein [Colocasia esculenta]
MSFVGILNSVLDISKVEAGKMQLEEVEFNVAEVIEESMDIFHVVAWKKGLEMIWDPCDGSVLNSLNVKGDPDRLKQILDNLLSNAIKFTSEGHVLVRAWAKRTNVEVLTRLHNYACNFPNMPRLLSCFSYGNGVAFDAFNPLYPENSDPNLIEFVFEVDDTGMGIPKDRRKSVFENYVQVKESINEQEGTGLGLGIVQSYVRLMGGEINIIDKGSSQKGTCFRFNIFLKSLETMDEKVDIICHDGEASTDLPNSSISIKNSQCACHNTNQSRAQAVFCKGLKHDTIHVLLLIQGEETKRMCKRWLESLGAKVWVVDQWELLAPAFEKIKQKLGFSHFNIFEKSHGVVPEIQVEISKIQNDNGIDIEESLRTKDGLDFLLPHGTPIHELHKKTSVKSTSMYALILIDMSFGPIQDALFSLNNFVKGINYDQYKVIWLANSDTPTTDLRSLRNKEAPCDLILHKPLHGSRLHAILKLLQEFGETVDVIADGKTNDMLQEKDKLYVNLNGDKPLHGMKVLVVEDNVVLRRLASSMLSHLGAFVELSENGKDALELVRKVLRDKSTQDVEKIEKENMEATRHLPYDIILMDCEVILTYFTWLFELGCSLGLCSL